MVRRFNPVGPCQRDLHYILDPQERLPLVAQVIDQLGYFWVHGPRQTGKTTALSILAQDLTNRGQYAAVLVSAAAASVAAYEEAIAEDAFLYELQQSARLLPESLRPPQWEYQVPGQRIRAALSTWATACPRPLVIFIDDVDALDDRPLLSLLRQIAGGFSQRPRHFPQSIGFIGLQDVNELSLPWGRRTSRQEWMTPGSLFHRMKAASFTLNAFTVEDVANLYQKHTNETGQLFTLEAVDRAFEVTQGQPWLVNVLANQVIANTGEPIESLLIDVATEQLIGQQKTHIDHLFSRLWEKRVQNIVEPLLMGQPTTQAIPEDLTYVLDSGLCCLDRYGGLLFANPIYKAIAFYHLSTPALVSLTMLKPDDPSWVNFKGVVNVQKVLEALLSLWQHQGDTWLDTLPYRGIAPYLAISAFFQRIVRVHGHLSSTIDLAQNRLRLDWQSGAGLVYIVVMVWRDRQPDPLDDGLTYLETVASTNEASQTWLILVDQRAERNADWQRTRLETSQTASGRSVAVLRG
ncbi:MAG: ATP-binding protein [Leptolyngbyaceae bacterium]|nr:ATP-binding protein [Leptolyngbyaceae bacterium]